MPAYKPAQPSFLTKPSVHRLAESIAHQVGWAPGGDIHKTIQNLGGRVETEDTLLTDPDQTGSLFVDGADKFKIIVPAHTSPERDRSEEHASELQSLMRISYAVFCLKKKKK